jgi:hypothetical protein
MFVLIGLPLLERALEEVFGAAAIHTHLREVSDFHGRNFGFLDAPDLHGVLMRRKASHLFVQDIGEESPSTSVKTRPGAAHARQ